MKITISSFAIASSILMSTGMAYATGEACDENMHGQKHAQSQNAMGDMLFSKLDANGDGSITKAEFDAYNVMHFRILDTNNDGKITPVELRAIQDQVPPPPPPDQGMTQGSATSHLDRRFFEADINHDGGLDREEAKNMPMLSKYFDEVDANKDGKVTRQEYFDAMPLLHGVKKMDITGKSQAM